MAKAMERGIGAGVAGVAETAGSASANGVVRREEPLGVGAARVACPSCGSTKTRCDGTVGAGHGVYRYRDCTALGCGRRFRTFQPRPTREVPSPAEEVRG